MNGLACRLGMLALLGWAGAAHCQDADLRDPTRPPAALTAPVAGAAPLTGGQPQLQAILVSLRPGGRRIAVIDGKTMRQGDRLGDAVLDTIGTHHVVLRRGSKTETLTLFRPAARGATVQP